MKKLFPLSIFLAAMLCALLLFSCSHDIDMPTPPPEKPSSSSAKVPSSSSSFGSSSSGVQSSSSFGSSSSEQSSSSFNEISSSSSEPQNNSSSSSAAASSSSELSCGGTTYDPLTEGCCGSNPYTLATHFCDSRDDNVYGEVTIGTQIWMSRNLDYNTQGSQCIQCQYGQLYNLAAANTACPSGWHLPSKSEWETLINFAGGLNVAGKKLKAKTGWDAGAVGTDDYDFAALPGYQVNVEGRWWSNNNFYLQIGYNPDAYINGGSSGFLNVRCLKDD
jgi:uncharacterized protein (TIGR02145 family)